MPRTKKRRKRLLNKGVKIDTTTTPRGAPAANVSVQIDGRELRAEAPEITRVEEVVAEIPEAEGRSVNWKKKQLRRFGSAEAAGTPPSVESFADTHYGPVQVREYGVRVTLKTDVGDVKVQPSPEANFVHEADKPPGTNPTTRGRHG